MRGPVLRALLTREGRSCGWLARRLGLDPSTVQQWCTGRRSVSRERASAIRRHLAEARTEDAVASLESGYTAYWRSVGLAYTPPRPVRRRAPAQRPERIKRRSWVRWTPDEDAVIRRYAGQEPVQRIVDRLASETGTTRSATSVVQRACNLGLSLYRPGRTTAEVARVFGVGYRTVAWWHLIGALRMADWIGGAPPANRRQRPMRTVDDAELRRFVASYPWLVDWRRMAPGPPRAYAEVCQRRDPWLPLEAVYRALGLSRRTVAYWRGRGLVIRMETRPSPSGQRGRHYVRAADLPAIRAQLAALRAERAPGRPLAVAA